MASTYSPLLRLELIAAGEQAGLWGNTTNSNLGTLLEQAIAGITTIAFTSGSPATHTLSTINGTPDEARAAVLLFQGSPAAATTVNIPALQKTYLVKNATTQTLTLKTSAQTGGVAVVAGGAVTIFCDGTTVFSAIEKLQLAQGGTGASDAAGVRTVLEVPTRTGGDASGTWPISITGAAGTNRVPVGGIIMWSGSVASIPSGWALCNGLNGTPDLREKFIIGARQDDAGVAKTDITGVLTQTGGSKDAIVVSHTHGVNASGNTGIESTTHVHTVNDPGHLHGLSQLLSNTNVLARNGYFDRAAGGSPVYNTDGAFTGISLNGQSANHTHFVSVTGNTEASGASGTNARLPPYFALAFIQLISGAV